MNIKDHCLAMCDYSRWAMDRLMQGVDELDDEKYRANRKLFFTSIHGTLNHILLVERIWVHRCKGLDFQFSSLGDEQAADRAALRAGLEQAYANWDEFIRATPNFDFANPREYVGTEGEMLALPLGMMVLHSFNHATHHRGQVSTALTQFNVPAPVMDLPVFLRENPGAIRAGMSASA